MVLSHPSGRDKRTLPSVFVISSHQTGCVHGLRLCTGAICIVVAACSFACDAVLDVIVACRFSRTASFNVAVACSFVHGAVPNVAAACSVSHDGILDVAVTSVSCTPRFLMLLRLVVLYTMRFVMLLRLVVLYAAQFLMWLWRAVSCTPCFRTLLRLFGFVLCAIHNVVVHWLFILNNATHYIPGVVPQSGGIGSGLLTTYKSNCSMKTLGLEPSTTHPRHIVCCLPWANWTRLLIGIGGQPFQICLLGMPKGYQEWSALEPSMTDLTNIQKQTNRSIQLSGPMKVQVEYNSREATAASSPAVAHILLFSTKRISA